MRKLFVAGCSVSDYTKVEKVYGEYLSEKLNCDYVHEGAGCGSNWRIWRKITNYILNGELTSNDLLVVQYTTIERKEVWSKENYKMNNEKILLREDYKDGGNLVRFKVGSYDWQQIDYEKKFFNLYENCFLSIDYEREVFKTQNLMFQTMLKYFNIPTVFLGYYLSLNKNTMDLLPEFKKNSYVEIPHVLDRKYCLENDWWHLNDLGHQMVADKLYEYIVDKKK